MGAEKRGGATLVGALIRTRSTESAVLSTSLCCALETDCIGTVDFNGVGTALGRVDVALAVGALSRAGD